jgi:curli biogenesis system outer membrane secretion channel CsgG
VKKIVVGLLAAGALAGVPTAATAHTSVTATAACTSAQIAGQTKCIGAGQFCTRTARARKDYRKHGLDCTKRDANGRYHLQYS